MDSRPRPGGSACSCWRPPARREAGDGPRRGRGARAPRRARTLKIWFAVDTLEFLKRGGRIGAASAWIGSTLQGQADPHRRERDHPGRARAHQQRAFERMVDYARQRHESGADGWVVQHIQAPEQAERLVERCREIFGCEPVVRLRDRPGASRRHAGPGLLGVGAIPASTCADRARGRPAPPQNLARWQLQEPLPRAGRPDRPDRRLRRSRPLHHLPAAKADRLAARGARSWRSRCRGP